MISMMLAAAALLLEFYKLMVISLSPRFSWDVPPLALLFMVAISVVFFRDWLHGRLA